MEPIPILTNLGLSKKEAQLYLAALEVGEAPASKIASRAKLNRVTAYEILDKLAQKGFVSFSTKQGTKHYAATDPDLIHNEFTRKNADFERVLPQLHRIHGKTKHPRIRYYEGIEAIKTVYQDTLTAKTEILNYADSKSLREFWPDYDQEYVQKRIDKKIYLRGIAPLDEYGEKVAGTDAYREIRLVEKGPFSFKNEINIYDNKVSIISFGKDELIAMVIESDAIAETQRAIFMMAWEFAR